MKINPNLLEEEKFSTNETKTNKLWIDGKHIYRKSFWVNQYPNNTTTSFNHGLSFTNIIQIYGYGTDDSTVWLDSNSGSPSGRMTITVNQNQIFLYANTDRRSLHGYITLEYTKTD